MIEYRVGSVRKLLRDIPDGSVDAVITSPPFLGLRSYLDPEHPDKAEEIGSEPTPAAFLDTLLELSAEWRRVLAPHGSIAIELGDTYAGSGGGGGDYDLGGMRDGQVRFRGSAWAERKAQQDQRNGQRGVAGWPLAKSLCMIPQLYPSCLAYGANLLTGCESPAGQWRVRNIIAWCRPNPPVGALGDKCRPATSYITVACTGRRRWWDMDAERVPYSPNTNARVAQGVERRERTAKTSPDGNRASLAEVPNDGAGAPLLDWWEIPTQPYAGSHYATFPIELPRRLISLMCPLRVCQVCGKPSERIVGEVEYVPDSAHRSGVTAMRDGERVAEGVNSFRGGGNKGVVRTAPTLGWSDCGHDAWRPGVVLDPFAGSGTTLAAALGLGRSAIGIDLDERNVHLARERVGMFLQVSDRPPSVTGRNGLDPR